MPKGLLSLILLGACLAILPLSASANGDGVPGNDDVRGHALVQDNCARCHSIEKSGASPFAPAPPLRDLKDRYPLEGLEEAFAEGIVVGHPAMPEFQFDPDQIADLIAYLEWLGK